MTDRRFVYIVDDDESLRSSTAFFLRTVGFDTRCFSGGRLFMGEVANLAPGCVLLDIRMPVFDGFDVLSGLADRIAGMPVVVMTGHGDVASAVQAMKLGASDFMEKPYEEDAMLETLERVFGQLDDFAHDRLLKDEAQAKLARLTQREDDVLRGLIEGRLNKVIAFQLGLSVRTVEMHRASMMERLGVRTLPDALRIAFRAGMVASGASGLAA